MWPFAATWFALGSGYFDSVTRHLSHQGNAHRVYGTGVTAKWVNIDVLVKEVIRGKRRVLRRLTHHPKDVKLAS